MKQNGKNGWPRYRNDLVVQAMTEQGKTVRKFAASLQRSEPTITAIRQGKTNVLFENLLIVIDDLSIPQTEFFNVDSAKSSAKKSARA